MKKLFPFTAFFLIVFISYSQKVENVDFNFVDEKIVIFYDLVDCDSKYLYEVSIKFIDDKGNTITPRILKGDFGIVPCGVNKVAEWELFREVGQFEGNYKVIITITSIRNKFGKNIALKPGNNTILLSPVIIYAPFGIKYHYSKMFGIYASVNSDLGLSEYSVMFTTGVSFAVARTMDLYLGFGLGYDQWGDTRVFEGGVLSKNRNKVSFEAGILLFSPIYSGVFPGFRLGIGYNF